MPPFVILADLRTGSTLLSSSLNRHPRVRCYGELLHPDDFADNQPPGFDRHELPGDEVVRRALVPHGNHNAVGFRAMVFLPRPSHPHWRSGWQRLAATADLRVIYLQRRNRLAQYASASIAHQTGTYHPLSGNPLWEPDRRPDLVVDRAEFRRWVRQRDRMLSRRREQLRGKVSLEVWYESLTERWTATIRRVQAFLGVPYVPLEQAKQKQETRPLSNVISNYHELVVGGD